eukprot:764082-Hanusia_phi.AAC.5
MHGPGSARPDLSSRLVPGRKNRCECRLVHGLTHLRVRSCSFAYSAIIAGTVDISLHAGEPDSGTQAAAPSR